MLESSECCGEFPNWCGYMGRDLCSLIWHACTDPVSAIRSHRRPDISLGYELDRRIDLWVGQVVDAVKHGPTEGLCQERSQCPRCIAEHCYSRTLDVDLSEL